jgi:hypothetical protein
MNDIINYTEYQRAYKCPSCRKVECMPAPNAHEGAVINALFRMQSFGVCPYCGYDGEFLKVVGRRSIYRGSLPWTKSYGPFNVKNEKVDIKEGEDVD